MRKNAASQPTEADDWALTLFNTWNTDELPFPVAPCSPARDWVKEAGGGPYRCLPLKMAGEAGWAVHSPVQFTACWDGTSDPDGLQLIYEEGRYFDCVTSHFGLGVVTFNFPYLFRTPPGINLWVRGPANWFRDGIQAMEGLVETDWADSSFTMNWKLTRPGQPVRFEIGDPICVLVPFPRHFLERFQPESRKLASEPALAAANDAWQQSRASHLHEQTQTGDRESWQQTYYRGRDQSGETFPEHQRRLKMADFRDRLNESE